MKIIRIIGDGKNKINNNRWNGVIEIESHKIKYITKIIGVAGNSIE